MFIPSIGKRWFSSSGISSIARIREGAWQPADVPKHGNKRGSATDAILSRSLGNILTCVMFTAQHRIGSKRSSFAGSVRALAGCPMSRLGRDSNGDGEESKRMTQAAWARLWLGGYGYPGVLQV
ncbi:hypothetical protein BTVI_88004 [Pitangus sulphuratus]|nr:hypothetical protein BTVI_88004 [Pitangus sulphuratus]